MWNDLGVARGRADIREAAAEDNVQIKNIFTFLFTCLKKNKKNMGIKADKLKYTLRQHFEEILNFVNY